MSSMRVRKGGAVIGGAAVLASIIIFLVPFAFIFLTASKTRLEAAQLEFSLPSTWNLWQNVVDALSFRDYMLVLAFWNSTILTIGSVTLLVIFSAMIAYIWQRRRSRLNPWVNGLVLAGLIVPPAVVPTIWVMQALHIFKTMPGLIFIEVAFGLSFSVLTFRAFIGSIPRELDEAAILDGAGPLRLFFQVIFPLLRSVIITIVVVQSVFVFNDFQNPLYFLPGNKNATVQLTLFNFQSQQSTSYNLLFATILLVTIPMLVMYIFFNKRIVAGLTGGAIKG